MPSWVADAAMRLDVFLAKADPSVSRVKTGQLIRAGCVLVNGRIVRKPAHRLRVGDAVECSRKEEPASESHITPVDQHLKILYEDASCFVIEKPAGLSVHPAGSMAPGTETLLNGIACLFKKKRLPFDAAHVLVHRLDRETTGCLLIAKSPAAHRELQKQFKDRTIGKTYLAIVAGVPAHREATIDAPIGRNLTDRTRMSVLRTGVSRAARTTYHLLAQTQGAALLACDLHTGRTHQIRVHLSAIGHPLLGDPTYHSSESARVAERAGIAGLCLHAWKLTFQSPADERNHAITLSPPPAFRQAAKNLKLPLP
ncbi:MAG: RluA family pseudouridine synthase [Candidatus Peribacteraceae bacterium]|nr:RluA family pseudouridine synthase [Candidatus Peribacteraceae bacterium]